MKKVTLLLVSLSLYLLGYSQPQPKKIDSIVRIIEAKKDLSVTAVCDTSRVSNSDLSSIECLKFYFVKNKIFKAVYSFNYYRKDSVRNIFLTRFDVYYYNDNLLIKVISRDFDQTPPKDTQIYLNEKHRKKYLSKETVNSGRYDGVNYFVEFGYNFLEEFKSLTPKK